MSTRIGKIARLPQFIRGQLNRRIEDGEPGRVILAWLNGPTPVKEVLGLHFGGRAISKQNLSEWKQGGCQDWLRHQETRALARSFLAEAEEVEDEVGDVPLTDRMTEFVALSLARLLREALAEDGPNKRANVIAIIREFSRVRCGDREMQHVRIEQERWDAELDAVEKAELKAMEEKGAMGKMPRRSRGHGSGEALPRRGGGWDVIRRGPNCFGGSLREVP